MAKPAGARCNLRCDYCFFAEKAELYPGGTFRMDDDVASEYVGQVLGAGASDRWATIAWQGGEPTLMGLDFYQRLLEVERSATPTGTAVERTLQTNGVLLDAEWATFLHAHHYLVGLSIDGPRELHDAYRHDAVGSSVFDRVEAAARLLQQHGVEFNVMCTVNSANSRRPLDVYRYFRDELGARFIQFIPIVEVVQPPAEGRPGTVSERSVDPREYGRFLSAVFDEWVRRDVGEVFVPFFDGVLAAYVHGESNLCVLGRTCGRALALEHTGDVYSCDHFVDPEHLLGNLMQTPLSDLADSDAQRAFGEAKRATLPDQCRECRFLFACNGECPKNRILLDETGQPGLNWLCEGLSSFFAHTDGRMRLMADLVAEDRPASDVMQLLAAWAGSTRRNDPCPCGSGRKYKACCGS